MNNNKPPTSEEQATLDGFLRVIRHEKALHARRVERYGYLRKHREERESEIADAINEYDQTGDAEKLRDVLKKWTFNVSTFQEANHGRD